MFVIFMGYRLIDKGLEFDLVKILVIMEMLWFEDKVGV